METARPHELGNKALSLIHFIGERLVGGAYAELAGKVDAARAEQPLAKVYQLPNLDYHHRTGPHAA